MVELEKTNDNPSFRIPNARLQSQTTIQQTKPMRITLIPVIRPACFANLLGVFPQSRGMHVHTYGFANQEVYCCKIRGLVCRLLKQALGHSVDARGLKYLDTKKCHDK